MELYLNILSALMLIVGVYSLAATLLNIRHFRKLGRAGNETEGPLVSVVIPARNEEDNLPRLLDSLIAQTYRNIEILVINDQSEDRTEAIIREYEKKDSRVHGYCTAPGKRLNQNGKINALLQVLPHVRGEYILATDADTEHAPDCIAHSYAVMHRNGLDIISGFPKEICPSYMGLVSISAMMLTNIMIPHFIVYRFPIPSAAFAIGQFIMMRTDAYRESGGYTAISGTICDDVGIVRLFVRKKKKYAFISISEYVSCHMYGSAREAFRGIERSIAGIFPPKAISFIPILCLVTILVHIALSPAAVIALFVLEGFSSAFGAMLVGVLSFFISWYLACRKAGWRKLISIAAPLTIIQICVMYIHGLYNRFTGKGFIWKGRKIS